jgi:hypothetical protein
VIFQGPPKSLIKANTLTATHLAAYLARD